MTSPGISSTQSLVQSIKFTGPESDYATVLRGQVINIQCREGNHNHGSSKVKLTDRTDYNWEFKYYHGHLVAAHINGKIVAFAMKGKEGGMIRVAYLDGSVRTLIKNLKEEIKDLSFAYSNTEIILGCVDCEGNIIIYNIEDCGDSINYTLLLHIFHKEPARPKTNFRLAWCPYVPSTEEDLDLPDESEKMFVVLNGQKAEIYNVATLNSKYGNKGPLDPDNSYEGYTEIVHTSDLVDASFSSDGCAIALACQDGYVKFFQLFMFDADLQKCLHEWIPHERLALTSVIFVDNILEYTPHCWKFAITGANNNTELKLWSCETWTCLQTINFLPNPKGIIPDLFLNVAADYTGKYLVVSDINNRGIYILELQKFEKKQLIHAGQISHFLVPAPFLSFHILDAGTKTIPYCYDNSSDEIFGSEDELDDEAEKCIQTLKMLVIQPKKFQECNITFQPEGLIHSGIVVTENVLDELVNLKNGEIQEEPVIEKMPELDDLQNSVTLLIQQQKHSSSKLTLMTPDDFTSPGKTSKSSSIRNSITNETDSEIIDKTMDSVVTEYERPQKDNFASAGSSPSREVQEILSLNNSSSGYPTQEYFNNLANLQVQDEVEAPQKEYSDPAETTLLYQDSVNWPKISLKDSEAIKQIKEASSNDINKQDLETVYLRMNGLEEMIKAQSIAMEQMHKDLKAMNLAVMNNSGRSSNKKDPEDLSKELEAAMSKQHLQIAKLLENLMQLQKAKDRELQENLMGHMNQILSKSVAEKVPQIVQHEIKHTVLPSIHQLMESYRHQLETQYNHKFTGMDAAIKENLAKVLGSKSLVESISVSIVNLITPTLEKSYKDAIGQTLVPSWERVAAEMFQQLSSTFSRGTKEYTASIETYMERQRRAQDKGKELMCQMQSASDSLKGHSDKLADTLHNEIQKQFSTVFKNIQDKLVHSVKETVNHEIKSGLKNQAALIEEGVMNAVSRSRAVTPAPHADYQVQTMAHVQQALAKRNYDEAFQMALSAENLNLVIFVCERVDVNKVLGEQCMLSQSVLLALMQQLSMELHKNTETKLSFIRAAFLALSPDVPQTKHFIPKLLRDLIKQLTGFMQSNPPLKQNTEARLLKMAVESMHSHFVTE